MGEEVVSAGGCHVLWALDGLKEVVKYVHL